jgi:hypothetical protein
MIIKKMLVILIVTNLLFIIISGSLLYRKNLYISELQSTIEMKDKEIEKLKTDLSNQESDLRLTKELYKEGKDLVTLMLKHMNSAQISQLVRNCWVYEIEVNGRPIPKNGIIEMKEGKIKISSSQTMKYSDFFPPSIYNQGRISGDYTVEFLELQPDEEYGTDGTVVSAVHYVFKSVEKDTVITMKISEELQERLGFENNIIKIVVK